MRLTEIKTPNFQGEWAHNCPHDHSTRAGSDELLAAYRPYVNINMRNSGILTEATYKELAMMIDPNFLRQGIRASELEGIELQNFDPDDTMNFYVNSSEFEENHIRYLNQIKFDDFDLVGNDADLKNAKEKALMLLWIGNIRVHCSCPSFLFWGYQYILTILDASIYPEIRKPVIRNPQERGIVCKHMNRILKVLPFYNGDLAEHVKAHFGS